MTNKCLVCGNRSKPGDCLPFHRFPDNIQRRQQWLEALNLEKASKWHYVCGRHFQTRDYNIKLSGLKILKREAIPFLLVSEATSQVKECKSTDMSRPSTSKNPGNESYPCMRSSSLSEKDITSSKQTITTSDSGSSTLTASEVCYSPLDFDSEDQEIAHTIPESKKFPKDTELIEVWKQIIGISKPNISNETRICSNHFSPGDILCGPGGKKFLRKGAEPRARNVLQKKEDSGIRKPIERDELTEMEVIEQPKIERFPADLDDRAIWLSNLGAVRNIHKYSRICSTHFRLEDFEIKPSGKKFLRIGANPLIFGKRDIPASEFEQEPMPRIPFDDHDYEAPLKSFSLWKNVSIPQIARIGSTHSKEDDIEIKPREESCLSHRIVPVSFVNNVTPSLQKSPQLRLESISRSSSKSRGSSTITALSDDTEREDDFEEKPDITVNPLEKCCRVENTDVADWLRKSGVKGKMSLSKFSSVCSTYFKNVDFEIKTSGGTLLKKNGVSLLICDGDDTSDTAPRPDAIPMGRSLGSDFEENVRIIYSSDSQPYAKRKRNGDGRSCGNYYDSDSGSSNTLSASENEYVQTVTSMDLGGWTKKRKKPKPVLEISSSDFSTHRKAVRNFRVMRKIILSQKSKIKTLQQSLRRWKSRATSAKVAERYNKNKKRL